MKIQRNSFTSSIVLTCAITNIVWSYYDVFHMRLTISSYTIGLILLWFILPIDKQTHTNSKTKWGSKMKIWLWIPKERKKRELENQDEIYLTKNDAIEDKWRWTIPVKLEKFEINWLPIFRKVKRFDLQWGKY